MTTLTYMHRTGNSMYKSCFSSVWAIIRIQVLKKTLTMGARIEKQ